MHFIETPTFTRRVVRLLGDERYRALQTDLIGDPEKGAIVRGSGGVRKLRWTIEGRGKSGGVRVIYYWISPQQTFLMLLIYGKNEQDNLTSDQLKILRRLVEAEFDER